MKREQTVNIEISDKEWEGIYSNFAVITHSSSEFIIDFARVLPGANKAKVFSRIVMTPQHARALLLTLENNIKKFENDFGKIPEAGQDLSKGPIGFQTNLEQDSNKAE